MRSGNPTLNDNTFQIEGAIDQRMTLQGTVNKTFAMLAVVVIMAVFMWGRTGTEMAPVLLGSAIGGFIVAMVTIFKKSWAPVTTPVYAALEGIVLGAISSLYEKQFPGIVIHAIVLTFGTLGGLLFAYKSRLIQATENFKLGVAAATFGIAILYLVDFIMHFMGHSVTFIHEAGWLGIGFSAFVVVIAALNLVLDFDFIEKGAEQGAPKYMEWYGAFGLIVTLVWLYLEILRLLSKLRRRN